MAGLADQTDQAPVRRMSVACGMLRTGPGAPDGPPAAAPSDGQVDPDHAGAARAAALAAMKDAARLLPEQHPVQVTHLDVLLRPAPDEPDAVACTTTVQAYARGHLEHVALLGAAVALLALRQAQGRGGEVQVALVQNVPV